MAKGAFLRSGVVLADEIAAAAADDFGEGSAERLERGGVRGDDAPVRREEQKRDGGAFEDLGAEFFLRGRLEHALLTSVAFAADQDHIGGFVHASENAFGELLLGVEDEIESDESENLAVFIVKRRYDDRLDFLRLKPGARDRMDRPNVRGQEILAVFQRLVNVREHIDIRFGLELLFDPFAAPFVGEFPAGIPFVVLDPVVDETAVGTDVFADILDAGNDGVLIGRHRENGLERLGEEGLRLLGVDRTQIFALKFFVDLKHLVGLPPEFGDVLRHAEEHQAPVRKRQRTAAVKERVLHPVRERADEFFEDHLVFAYRLLVGIAEPLCDFRREKVCAVQVDDLGERLLEEPGVCLVAAHAPEIVADVLDDAGNGHDVEDVVHEIVFAVDAGVRRAQVAVGFLAFQRVLQDFHARFDEFLFKLGKRAPHRVADRQCAEQCSLTVYGHGIRRCRLPSACLRVQYGVHAQDFKGGLFLDLERLERFGVPGEVAEVVQRGHDAFARGRRIKVGVAVGFDHGFVRRLVNADQMAEIRVETLADDLDDLLRMGD